MKVLLDSDLIKENCRERIYWSWELERIDKLIIFSMRKKFQVIGKKILFFIYQTINKIKALNGCKFWELDLIILLKNNF